MIFMSLYYSRFWSTLNTGDKDTMNGNTIESPQDRRVEQAELVISRVLRAGVLLSAGVITAGVIDFWIFSHRQSDSQNLPHSIAGVWMGLTHGEPSAIILAGLLLLIATPVIRVAVSIIAFAVNRDLLYVGITCLVLAILLVSLFSGVGGGG
jgi:uncharacterized membrane protein